ncbi:MAG: hypothetical protein E7169_03010 [Firmicutes bacterium]|nr:hypothetical protein [Bacillota bacterium]
MVKEEYLLTSSKVLENKERFIKQLLFSSKNIVCNNDFEKIGLKNRNMMFFLNYIIENLSSISMLGSRNLNNSLLGKINKIISYYEDINKQFETKEKMAKIPKYKIDYIRDAIKTNKFINEDHKKRYIQFINENDDLNLIENLKLIYISLINNKYFDTISDNLYDLVTNKEIKYDNFDKIAELSNEYFALLIDYIGISIFEIKKIIRDAYRNFFKRKSFSSFSDMFIKFAEQYGTDNKYTIFIKMDKDFDEKLLNALKQSGNNNYIIYSKSGLVKFLEDSKINNKKILTEIISNLKIKDDNNYYLSSEIYSKDIWQAIRKFKQKVLQPFIGSMLYSGIKVGAVGDYLLIEHKEQKKFINYYNFYDDIFKPLTQDRIAYSDVFKRYIIDNSDNDINKIIDEAVQLLPYYKNSESTLTKFTNTWFALETLFRNAGDNISKSLEEYGSYLVADRMISGYIYLTAVQINKMYKGFNKLSNNFVENIFLNFDKRNPNNCDFLTWKYEQVIKLVSQYELYFQKFHNEAKELLMNSYYLRNKQFHGNKNLQMETTVGFLYDIVNDTISFYIDYIDVYRDSEKNTYSLFNFIKNIDKVKKILINETDNIFEKISIAYDSVRKI